MVQEALFLKSLQAAVTYRISDDELTLLDSAGSLTAVIMV
jgi:heat shock protein HslJ